MRDYYQFLSFVGQIRILANLKFPDPENVEILQALAVENYKKAMNNWKIFGSMNIRELMKDNLVQIPEEVDPKIKICFK